jgi:hypothetical protein
MRPDGVMLLYGCNSASERLLRGGRGQQYFRIANALTLGLHRLTGWNIGGFKQAIQVICSYTPDFKSITERGFVRLEPANGSLPKARKGESQAHFLAREGLVRRFRDIKELTWYQKRPPGW